jgi:multisubunit Na+/H+ antiporter MnhG subunit
MVRTLESAFSTSSLVNSEVLGLPWLFLFCFILFEIGSHYMAQAGHEFTIPKCLDYSVHHCVPLKIF